MGLTLFRGWRRPFVLVAIVLSSVALFGSSFSVFFAADDWFHLEVSRVHSLGEFLNFFSFSRTPQTASFYRPLPTQVFFFVFQSLFGVNPIPYHVFIWVAFVILLYPLYEVAREIFKNEKVALAAVFIYAISATNFTRLYFMSAFQEILMTTFVLGALWSYLRSRTVISLVLFVFALMSKETALVLPGILFLADWWRKRPDLKKLLPFVFIALVYGYLRFVRLGGISGESYIWDFSVKRVGNSLMWYGLWSLGVPEFLVDYVGSGLRVLPRFFTNFSGWAYLILSLGVLVSSSLTVLVVQRAKSCWRALVLGSGIFIGSLLPVIFLPWHKFTLELGLPMVGVALAAGALLKKKTVIAYLFVLAYVLANVSTNVLYLSRHYSVNRAKLSYEVYQYFLKNYPVPPQKSYFEFVNDSSDYGPEWGSSKQIAQATSDSNMFKVLYR